MRTPWPLLVAICYVLALLKSGVWYFPSIGAYADLAADPFLQAPGITYSYQAHNWLSAIVSHAVGATSKVAFTVFHFGLSAAFFLSMAWLFRRSLSEAQSRVALVIFLALPMSYTSHFWIGIDGLTLLLVALLVLCHRMLALVFLCAVGLGLQHFEQAMFATVGALGVSLIAPRFGFVQPLKVSVFVVAVLGVFVGKLALTGLFAWLEIELVQNRADWMMHELSGLVWDAVRGAPAIWYSTLGVAWLVLLRSFDMGRAAWAPVIGLAALSLVMIVTEDQTRVYAVISSLVLINAWLLNPAILHRMQGRWMAGLFAAWLVVPIAWVLGGDPRWATTAYPLGLIADQIWGLGLVEGSPSYWPFR